MDIPALESVFPLNFREKDAKILTDALNKRQSLSLVGIKRVGIHTFLRFFLFHPNAASQYLRKKDNHVFIMVDLNDLVELELFPFWRLTLKRISDFVLQSNVSEDIKRKISQKFTYAIQSGDEFLTYDSVRESLQLIAKEAMPTLFFTRFDRLHNKLTKDYLVNLEAMQEATHGKLSYIFTSFREYGLLTSSIFAATHYIKPASYQDADAMLLAFVQRQHIVLSKEEIQLLLDVSGGHMQLLYNLLLALGALRLSGSLVNIENFSQNAIMDERVSFLLEEIWESMEDEEKEIIKKVALKELKEPIPQRSYLLKTGFIYKKSGNSELFSQILKDFIIKQGQKKNASGSLSDKESLLFNLIKNNQDKVCSRDMISAYVWPEYEESGVTDWSIDRLVARLRVKLKEQGAKYEIITVRTRGYKLVTV